MSSQLQAAQLSAAETARLRAWLAEPNGSFGDGRVSFDAVAGGGIMVHVRAYGAVPADPPQVPARSARYLAIFSDTDPELPGCMDYRSFASPREAGEWADAHCESYLVAETRGGGFLMARLVPERHIDTIERRLGLRG